MPRTPQEQMAMAPEVFKFTREFGRGQQIQEKPSVIQQIAGTLGNVALAGAGIAGAYGLARALSPETEISPVSTGATSDVGEIPTRVGQKGFVRHPTPHKEPTREVDPSKIANLYDSVAAHDFGSPTDDGFVEPYVRTTNLPEDDRNYGNQEIPVKDPRSNRFESIRQQEEDRAELDYIMSGGAALDQAFEDAVARDDMRDERVAAAIVEGPETVIEPTESTKGFLDAFSKEVQDFDHNIPWGERVDQAASSMDSGSALGAAGIMAGTVAEKGFKDVGTRARKIVQEVPKTINKVKEGLQEAANVITHEQIKASTYAEAARINAGLPPLLGSDVVEVGIESDLSDNAQFDDPHQTNEQMSPAGLNRQDTTQTVIDLANTLSKGLAHLSPEDRMDLARKMIDEGYNS